jgi:SPP1 gp7 family putative phage head morphogenesis protein
METYKQLFGSFKDGFKTVYKDGFEKALPLQKQVLAQVNLVTFSGVKAIGAQQTLGKKLYDADGKILSKEDFAKEAQKLNKEYNINHLNAERQACIGGGISAGQWQQVQASKDVYPYLRYQTVGDAHVRPEHQALNGITKPVDDPFWQSYFPPNGWNCRCNAEPVMEGKVTSDKVVSSKVKEAKVPSAFQTNPGISGQVFNVDAVIMGSLIDRRSLVKIVAKVLERFGKFELKTHSSGGLYLVHPQALKQAAKSKNEMAKWVREKDAMEQIIANGKHVLKLPEDSNSKDPQPDLFDLLDWSTAEIKHIDKATNLGRAIKTQLNSARKQGVKRVYIFMPDDATPADIIEGYKSYAGTPEGKKQPFGDGNAVFFKGGEPVYQSPPKR